MSDYLTNLLARTQNPERTIQPRVLSIFDPVSPASMGEEVSGWDSREELHQPVSRRDLSARQSSEVTGQDQEDGGLLHEFDTRPRERTSMSTPDRVRLTSSSEAVSAGTPSVLSSLDSDQLGATPKTPSEANAINLSPIDPTVVADSSAIARMRPAQENPASYSGSAAQSANSRLGILSERTKSAGQGGSSLLTGEPSSESQDNPSVVPTTQAHDQELNHPINTRGVRVSAASSQQPLVRAATARSDGEQHYRFPRTVSEPGGRLAELRKEAVADGHTVSELSLDPSLVVSVAAPKVNGNSRHPITSKPGDAPMLLSSPSGRREPIASQNFLAVRRAASPMTGATISQTPAADRVKPVEPVVQVTIGRVEVRAMAPPVRQQKNPKPPSAMSLDDYLKRRGGRSDG